MELLHARNHLLGAVVDCRLDDPSEQHLVRESDRVAVDQRRVEPIVLAGQSRAACHVHLGAAQLGRVQVGVVRLPPRATRDAPHVHDVSASAITHDHPNVLQPKRIAGSRTSTVGRDSLVELGLRDCEIEHRRTGHRDAGYRVGLGGLELLVDQRRKFFGQECLPLVAAEDRIIALPVGVIRECTADRGDHVDVLVGEELCIRRLGGPGCRILASACAIEQVEGGYRLTGVLRMQHRDRDRLVHRRRVDDQRRLQRRVMHDGLDARRGRNRRRVGCGNAAHRGGADDHSRERGQSRRTPNSTKTHH